MQHTEYDRDTEAIEPLVPFLGGPTEQSTDGAEKRSTTETHRDGEESPKNRLPHLEGTTYYTWDVEMIEPLVPVITPRE